MVTLLAWLVWGLASVAIIYLTLLSLVTLGRPKQIGALDLAGSAQSRFAIVVPAHNEALLIAQTVQGLCCLDYDKSLFVVVVVANACSDETAALAAAAGARVIEFAPPGKGQALEHAFTLLSAEPWDAFVVIDADSQFDPWALQTLDASLAAGAEVLQMRYAVRNCDESWRTRTAAVQLASYNGIRPLGRAALGWSAGIFGNGFCLRPQVLCRVPHHVESVVEDLEYHLRLMQAGIRVDFTDDAAVWAQMPVTREQSDKQRVRWERGRVGLMRDYGGRALRDWLCGKAGSLARVFELFMPPIAWVVLALLLSALLGGAVLRLAALTMFFLLLVHYWLATRRYGIETLFWRVLAQAPYYIFEKLWFVLRSLVLERRLAWNRTPRHKEGEPPA